MGSVIGREFGLKTLAKVADVSEDSLLEKLEEAVAARVLAEVLNHVELYTFTHALIKETLYEELSTARRCGRTVRLAKCWRSNTATTSTRTCPSWLITSLRRRRAAMSIRRSTTQCVQGERSMELLAYEEAAGHYERASQVLELKEQADEPRRAELLLALATAQTRAGQGDAAVSTLDEAIALRESQNDAELLAKLALAYADAVVTSSDPFSRKEWSVLRQATDMIGPEGSASRARLLSRMGSQFGLTITPEERFALARDAMTWPIGSATQTSRLHSRVSLLAALGGGGGGGGGGGRTIWPNAQTEPVR